MNEVRPVYQKTRIFIRDLSFYYDQTKALKNVNLPLYEHQVTAFIGPAGR